MCATRIWDRLTGAASVLKSNQFLWFPLRRSWEPTKAPTYFRYPWFPLYRKCQNLLCKGHQAKLLCKGNHAPQFYANPLRDPLNISLKARSPLHKSPRIFWHFLTFYLFPIILVPFTYEYFAWCPLYRTPRPKLVSKRNHGLQFYISVAQPIWNIFQNLSNGTALFT